MISELNKFINTLKCPICQGRIDSIKKYDYNYGCEINLQHYILNIDKIHYQIICDKIIHIKNNIYITIFQQPPNNKIDIIYDLIDQYTNIISYDFYKPLHLNANLDFNNLNIEQILSKIETYRAFQ